LILNGGKPMTDLTDEQRAYLNAQYMPRQAVPNADDYLAAAAERSAMARNRLGGQIDLPYGDSERQTLDVFPASRPDAPVHVFIHGGYWRALDKSFYSEMAEPLVAAGATVVLPRYDLCPNVSVTEIVAQMRQAMSWVYHSIAHYNGDPEKVYISGHSAGGHLVGMMLATDWKREADIPNTLIKGAVPISGLFDLSEHVNVDVQEEVRLTAEEIQHVSPVNLMPVARCPVVVAVGGGEPDLFHWQSLIYAAHLRRAGINAEVRSIGDDNHFDITDRLAIADDPLTQVIKAQMGLAV